jgi:hypothetical protein
MLLLVLLLMLVQVRSGVGTLTVVRGLLLASAALAAGLTHGVPPVMSARSILSGLGG